MTVIVLIHSLSLPESTEAAISYLVAPSEQETDGACAAPCSGSSAFGPKEDFFYYLFSYVHKRAPCANTILTSLSCIQVQYEYRIPNNKQ